MSGNNRLRSLLGFPDRIGLGGEGILRTEGRVNEALAVLKAAYESGIRYYDSAPAYAQSEEYQGIFWSENPRARDTSVQAGKSAHRDARGAVEDLARTLQRTRRDRLGLWQVHDIRDKADLAALEGTDGALNEFIHARETGLARGIGVTGHHNPKILLQAVSRWDIDAVLLPVNPVEAAIGGFIDRVIPAARERGIGVIGMKTLGAANFIYPDAGLNPDALIRFALSQDVDMVIVGCSTAEVVRTLAGLGKARPMAEEEQNRMTEAVRPYAERLAFYRGVF